MFGSMNTLAITTASQTNPIFPSISILFGFGGDWLRSISTSSDVWMSDTS